MPLPRWQAPAGDSFTDPGAGAGAGCSSEPFSPRHHQVTSPRGLGLMACVSCARVRFIKGGLKLVSV